MLLYKYNFNNVIWFAGDQVIHKKQFSLLILVLSSPVHDMECELFCKLHTKRVNCRRRANYQREHYCNCPQFPALLLVCGCVCGCVHNCMCVTVTHAGL